MVVSFFSNKCSAQELYVHTSATYAATHIRRETYMHLSISVYAHVHRCLCVVTLCPMYVCLVFCLCSHVYSYPIHTYIHIYTLISTLVCLYAYIYMYIFIYVYHNHAPSQRPRFATSKGASASSCSSSSSECSFSAEGRQLPSRGAPRLQLGLGHRMHGREAQGRQVRSNDCAHEVVDIICIIVVRLTLCCGGACVLISSLGFRVFRPLLFLEAEVALSPMGARSFAA